MEVKDLPILVERIQLRVSKRKLIDLLREQLNRDFNRANIREFELSSENLSLWEHELSVFLQSITSEKLAQLQYIIDIPEELANQSISENNDAHHLAKMILLRELLKIYYRLQYK